MKLKKRDKMKVTHKILQLQRLGKKQKRFIVRKEEIVTKTLSISSKVFGPTTLKNCENFLKRVENE